MGIIPGLLNYSAMPELSGTVHGTIGHDMLAHNVCQHHIFMY